jgi:signal transduction histidine kinase
MSLAAQSDAAAPSDRLAETLQAAGAYLARRLDPLLDGTGPLSRRETMEALDHLLGCVGRVLEGSASGTAVAELVGATLHLRLIDGLLDAVVSEEVTTDAQAAMVVLRALRSVRCALGGKGSEDLETRMSQPDAFELLVEVAHDLRSPLTSILFLSEALRAGHSGQVNETQRSQLGLIYSAALGLASVSQDIVDLARDGRGLIEGEREPYSLAEVFQGVEDLLRPMAEEKHIELRVTVEEFERSHGYPIALGRVLLNLASNALKFTDQGHVELGVHRRARQLEFFVRDTGRGISPDRQDDLFQPFKKRADQQGQFFSGSGVGLSIARRLVRGMGSELEWETTPEVGTRFWFVLDEPMLQ